MDYTPFTSAGFPQRPQGIQTGMDIGLQDYLMRQAQVRGLAEQDEILRKRQMENSRYEQMTPLEVQIKNLEAEVARRKQTDPNYITEMLKGDMGKSQQETAKGKVATATADTEIEDKNAKNRSEQLQATLQFIDQHSNLIKAAEASDPTGAAAQQAWGRMRELMPANFREQFPEMYSPQAASGMEKLRTALADSVGQRQTMAKQELENKGRMDVAREHTRATIGAAQVRANRQAQTLIQQFTDAVAKKNMNNVIAFGQMLLTMPDLNERDRAMVDAAMKQANINLMRQEAAKQTPPLSGLPSQTPQDRLNSIPQPSNNVIDFNQLKR